MKLFVGLGNPGDRYERTRHNVGFMLIDKIAEQFSITNFQFSSKFKAETAKTNEIILAKPQTFMNDSGSSVRALVDYFKVPLDQVWVIHDDLDIRMGEFKIQLGTGPKVHNGVNSVEQLLGTKDFWHIRIGVDNRTSEERKQQSGRDYVLKHLSAEELIVFDQVFADIISQLA